MSRYNDIKELSDDMRNSYVSNSDKKRFLPFDQHERFVNQEIVRWALKLLNLSNPDLENYVLQKGRQIFLILLGMEELKLLDEFRLRGIDDNALPIEITKDGGEWHVESDDGKNKVSFGNLLNNQLGDLFETNQTRHTVPVFGTENKFHFRLNATWTLPFLPPKLKPDGKSEGYFGDVERKEIHYAHVHGPDLKRVPKTDIVVVAVKRYKDESIPTSQLDFYLKEAQNLEGVRKYNLTNLIRPIAAYTVSDDRYLIFPWAYGEHLGKYWEELKSGPVHIKDIQWVMREFVGICDTLRHLHDDNCRHGDLKPENILWFKDDDNSTLKIADLGLATFHKPGENTNIRKDRTLTPSGTSRYKPPEMYDGRDEEAQISRGYDIWSMGCVLLELLVWLLYGNDGKTQFRDNTKTHFWYSDATSAERKQIIGQRFKIHPHVAKCMGCIRKDLQGLGELELICLDLLGLLETKLLVIEPWIEYLNSETKTVAQRSMVEQSTDNVVRRACTGDVHNSMENIYQKFCRVSSASSIIRREYPVQKDPEPAYVFKKGGALAGERQDKPRIMPTERDGGNTKENDLAEFGGRIKLDRQATLIQQFDSLKIDSSSGRDNEEA